ncbi:PREDICTED: dolichyl-diphosphooligosaccharide--protein glycosyltransferase subunit DAD1, partial [Acanthisitta chloris]|uniref:dolichyl-diphosphooligosaccharide--protein glycosyltransferase subunit DAD1 n=1 Tax=Acanthisitta chloris TaxID=57068 RepID=UPI0004F0D49B
ASHHTFCLCSLIPFSVLPAPFPNLPSPVPAVCLRIQINPQNKGEFQGISPERAFADFLFANTILHLVVINFVG